MLAVRELRASYGTSEILFGISLQVGRGEVVSLLGRNGMGKTTTLASIMGIVRPRAGSITFNDEPLHGLPPYRIARAGLGFVPEGRQIFPRLNVLENLTVAFRAPAGSPAWDAGKVFALFPRLAERRSNMGNQLSGGEQQMLAIGRALMTNPRLLILDEATEGLAPLIRAEIWRVIRRLKDMGQSILIVDKHVNVLARIADRHYILEKGRVAWTGSSAELVQSMETQRRLLGV